METLANVAHVLAKGAAWYRSFGTTESPGTVVCTVVGDAERAGVVEVECGTPLREVLTSFGAPRPGRTIRAVLPGVTNAVLTEAQLDTPLAFETFAAIGSGLGAAGFVVYDDTACMVDVAAVLSRFLFVESCGQCPPCKLGTGAITGALDDIAAGRGSDASFETLNHWLSVVADANRCFLPVEEQQLIGSILRTFPDDFELHLRGECTRPHRDRAEARRHRRRPGRLRREADAQTPRLDLRRAVTMVARSLRSLMRPAACAAERFLVKIRAPASPR